IQVEALELLGVIELFARGIGQFRVLMQNLQVQLIGPPTRVRRCSTCHCVFGRAVRERTFCIARHGVLIVNYGRSWVCNGAFRHGTSPWDLCVNVGWVSRQAACGILRRCMSCWIAALSRPGDLREPAYILRLVSPPS